MHTRALPPRALLLPLPLALLAATARGQAPLTFTVDQPASQWHWDGDTSLGPLEGDPSQDFELAGTFRLELAAGATPIASGRFVAGGLLAVVPDLAAIIPNPVPIFPPLAEIDVTNLTLDIASTGFAVDGAGAFTTDATLTILSGVVTITPLVGNQTQNDLTGTVVGPGPMTGTLSQVGGVLSVVAPYQGSFQFTDAGTGISATLDLTGTLVGDHACAPPVSYCSTNPNSTGFPAVIGATGSTRLQDDALVLGAAQLPPNQFGYFLFAASEDFVPNFGGSDGNLCLGTPIVRFAKDIQLSDALGTVSFSPSFGALPQGTVFQVGETWRFQYWTRDGQSSNTTDGVALTFCP